jgi:dipeptide/tripeptide permease
MMLQKRFNTFPLSRRTLCIALFVVFGGVIWLLPGLTPFNKLITSIIYLTVLSLFQIESDNLPKFKDHSKFLLMIFIYSGFWVLYFQMFDSVLWYVNDYVDASALDTFVNKILGGRVAFKFDVEHVTVINAGTIILLQLVVSNVVKNIRALPTMIAGIALGTAGMAVLAISTNIWVFIAGIIVFSLGEMTAHPKFISYVGLTAPKDRVATYMGYIFLYGVIGSSIGAILGANLYVHFVDELHQPTVLWLIFSGIGVATILGLLAYDRLVKR